MSKRNAISMLTWLLLCSPSHAFFTNDDLRNMLKTEGGTEQVKAYVYGVADTFALGRNANIKTAEGVSPLKRYCLPAGTTRAEVFEAAKASVISPWLPAELPAVISVSAGLSQKWPCQNQ